MPTRLRHRSWLVISTWLLCSSAGAQAVLPPTAADTLDAAPLEPATRNLRSWDEARQLLATHQPALRAQQAALLRARASVERVLSRLLPRLEFSVGAGYQPVHVEFPGDRVTPVEHAWLDGRSLVPNATAALSITFSLSDLSLLSSARTSVQAEQQLLAARRHTLLAALAGTVLGVLAAERVAARSDAGLVAARERMRLAERLVALGRATTLDVLRFAQDLSEARSNVVSANEALSQAREDLAAALGLPEPVGLGGDFDSDALLPAPASGCRPIAHVDERPERRAANERAEQTALASRAASLAYLPSVQLVSQYGARYAPTYPSGYAGPRGVLHAWEVSANLVWTALDGGARAADVTRTAADQATAQAERSATTLETVTEYCRSQRLVSVAGANVEIARQSLESARSADALSRKALELGDASALEVVDAARRLRADEITLAVREVEWLAATVRARMASSVCE